MSLADYLNNLEKYRDPNLHAENRLPLRQQGHYQARWSTRSVSVLLTYRDCTPIVHGDIQHVPGVTIELPSRYRMCTAFLLVRSEGEKGRSGAVTGLLVPRPYLVNLLLHPYYTVVHDVTRANEVRGAQHYVHLSNNHTKPADPAPSELEPSSLKAETCVSADPDQADSKNTVIDNSKYEGALPSGSKRQTEGYEVRD